MGFSRALCRRLWLFLKMGHTAHPDKFALSVSGITAGRGTFSKRVTRQPQKNYTVNQRVSGSPWHVFKKGHATRPDSLRHGSNFAV